MDRSPSVGEASELERLRGAIDRLDRSFVDLLGERLELARRIGAYKATRGLARVDLERERLVFERADRWAEGRVPPAFLRGHFELLIHGARAVQTGLRIAHLGPTGTHSEAAARAWFPEAELVERPSLAAVVASVGSEADLALVPWWNRWSGAVSEVQDAMRGTGAVPLRWINVAVEHVLASKPSADPPRTLFARPEPYAGARSRIGSEWPELACVWVASNGEAARRAALEPGTLALTTARAAEAHGLRVMAEAIDGTDNLTTFALIGPTGR